MKKISNTIKSLALLAIVSLATIACDKDFANIDSNIQGIKNFETNSKKFPVVSYSQKISDNDDIGVQTNGLPGNLLGVYPDPNSIYGMTTASVVSQLTPTNFNADFGTNPVLESVILTIPYFSSLIEKDSDGNSTYELDSIFGNPEAVYNLSIYQSNYLLRDLDPASDFEDPQAYYSSQEDIFCSQLGQLLYEEDDFKPSNEEIRIPELDDNGDPVMDDDGNPVYAERIVPSLRVDLNDSEFVPEHFWEDLIFANQDNDVLSNSNNFRNFFRGLIFKVEAIGTDGNMQMIDFSNSLAGVVLDYINDEEIEEGEEDIRNPTAYRLVFNGVRANTINNDFTLPTIPDTVDGDDKLHLKGGDGSMAVIELFNGTTLDEDGLPVDAFTFFKNREGKWLINEANLIFYVNQDDVNDNEPDRLLLYDLKNNTPIIDYLLDGTTNTSEPTKSKTAHSEILERDDDDNGIKYKFRLTEHINGMLLRDSTNVKLGLYVANDVNLITNSKVENTIDDQDDSTINTFPTTSVLSLKSTVLHGSKPSIPEGNRVEFEIYYTETEN